MPRDARGRVIRKPHKAKQKTGTKRSLPAESRPESPIRLGPNWKEAPIESVWANLDTVGDYGMTTVYVLRNGLSGITMAAYLVDVWGFGLKDAFIKEGVARSRWRHIQQGEDDGTLVEIDLETAQRFVYGGIAWAKRWGIRTPPEVLDVAQFLPAPASEPDLSEFGRDGKPLLMAKSGDMERFMPGRDLNDLTNRGIDFVLPVDALDDAPLDAFEASERE